MKANTIFKFLAEDQIELSQKDARFVLTNDTRMKVQLKSNSLDGSTTQGDGSSNLESVIKQKIIRLTTSPPEV